MFSRSNVCPHCGRDAPRDGEFCPHCGKRLAGGVRRCGVCGAENRGDARFCGGCGRPLDAAEAVEIQRHRWARPETDFAVRLETDDLPGLLKRGVKVEPGTNTMILSKGVNLGVMPPGEYTLGTIGQYLRDRITGNIHERITALLVDVTPVELAFHIGGRFTKDPLPVGLTLRLQVEVAEAGKFLVNVLKGRERISIDDVRKYLYPEVYAAADRWIKQHTLQELAEDPSQPGRLELAVEEALRATFNQSGLRFLQARTVELNLEPFEEITDKYSRANLLNSELQAEMRLAEANLRAAEQRAREGAESELKLEQIRREYEDRQEQAKLEARRAFLAFQQENDLLDLQADTRKVEDEEKRVDLYQRMRQAASADRMNEVRSEADFKRFLDEVDREGLLREKERQDLLSAWKEAEADRQSARAHLLAKLDVERDYELRVARLKLQAGLDEQQAAADQVALQAARSKLDMEIEVARKRADYDFELRRRTVTEELWVEQEKERIALERDKNRQQAERLERQQAFEDEREQAKFGVEMLSLMKANRRLDEQERLRIEREHTLTLEHERQRMKLDEMEALERQRLAALEAEERARQAEREHEIRRIKEMGALGTEALITLAGPDQARVLADLKRSENLRGLSEDQILALAAERSPEVARALEARYRALAEGQAGEREIELYERLLRETKEGHERSDAETARQARETMEASERMARLMAESHKHALDSVTSTAQAFAQNQGGGQPQVVIVPGAGQPAQPIQPLGGAAGAAAQPAQTRMCVTCGRFVSTETAFCQFCGAKLEPEK